MTLLVPQRNSRLRLRLEQFLERHGILPARVLECGSLYGVKAAAAAGLGVGLSSRSFVEPELEAGFLRLLIIEDQGFSLGVHWISYPEPSLNLASRELLELLWRNLSMNQGLVGV
jgi:DNA-binding transcriptional LysR family regulator